MNLSINTLGLHIGFSYAWRGINGKHLFLMSLVPSILAELTCFNFIDAGIPEVEFLGTDGYFGNVGLIGVSGGEPR